MTTTQLCAVEDCDREIRDTAYVCTPCGDRLRRLLAAMVDRPVEPRHVPQRVPGTSFETEMVPTGLPEIDPGLATQLVETMANVSTSVRAVGRLPYRYQTGEARWTLRDAMVAVADEIARTRGLFRPLNDLQVVARWLSTQIDWMRHQPAGGDLIGDLITAVRQAVRAIDNPAARVVVGACDAMIADELCTSVECGTPLYAFETDVEVECPGCGATHKTAETWDRMLARTEDLLLTRMEIVRALSGFGVTVSEKRLEHWAARGRLPRRGMSTGRPARPLYRLGDVRTLLAEAERAVGA
jgi:predicted RNA-binding Zn-ribbon protein involved in translation (DUF1610 family)